MHMGTAAAAGTVDAHLLRTDVVPREATVDAVFSAHARIAPAAAALTYGDRTITFGELEQTSSQIAARLQAMGVARGQRVALLAERSIETIIAMLAVLKAGAAYVPFDPTYTDERLSFMTEDCAPTIIIAQGAAAARTFAASDKIRAFDDLLQGAPAAAAAPLPGALSEDAAYVMYTSGTTGRPKGVIIPHRAILHLVRDQRFFKFSRDQVFLHLTTLSFDPSTLEIWGALLNGAQIAIVPQRDHHSLDDIIAVIRKHKPTSTCTTPGIFHLLVDHKLADIGPLKQIMSGGEILSPSHVRRALAAWPETTVVNAYGPTECTTLITYYGARADKDWGEGSVPIGEPLEHTIIEVLDENLDAVANGEVGELCAGGEGLAIGYLNRPELTAEKFIVRNGVRLYRTGDLVRRRPDGLLEFLGRSDTQVKIDGKRVELGEIEACLREDDRVTDAVVILDTTGRGKRLVAYLTPTTVNVDAAMTTLRTKLPPHMIPYHALTLDTIPLTANAKVDRARLPKPPIALQDTVTEPASDLEGKLRDVWRAVLGFDQIGTQDNFFDLGGTSVQLMEVHERVQKEFGRELEIVAMFEHPKITALARMLRGEDMGTGRVAAAQARAKLQGDALKRLRAARVKS